MRLTIVEQVNAFLVLPDAPIVLGRLDRDERVRMLSTGSPLSRSYSCVSVVKWHPLTAALLLTLHTAEYGNTTRSAISRKLKLGQTQGTNRENHSLSLAHLQMSPPR